MEKEQYYKKVKNRYVKIETPRFNIDFFEFSFLVAACIPPSPYSKVNVLERSDRRVLLRLD